MPSSKKLICVLLFIQIFLPRSAILTADNAKENALMNVCGFPGIPYNGNLVLTHATSSNKIAATYHCNENYILFGNPTRICQSDGTWNGSIPKCASDVSFNKPVSQFKGENKQNSPQSVVDGSLKNCSKAFAEGKECRTEINLLKKYNVFAFNITIQKFNGFNLAFFVGSIDNATNERIFVECANSGLGNSYTSQKTLFLKCLNSSYPNGVRGDTVRIVDNRNNSAYVEVCEVEIIASDESLCGTPDTPCNGEIIYHSPELIEYGCNLGHFIAGKRYSVCANGTWQSSTPVCQEFKCNLPPSIHHGVVRVVNVVSRQMAIYTCDENFYLQDNLYLNCSENGEWIGTVPECLVLELCDGWYYGVIIIGVVMTIFIIFLFIGLLYFIMRYRMLKLPPQINVTVKDNKYESSTMKSNRISADYENHYLEPIKKTVNYEQLEENIYECVK